MIPEETVTPQASGSQAFSRTDRSFLGAWWWTVDRALLGAVLVIAIIGVALVATASPSVAQQIGARHGDYHFLIRHILFLVPSLCIMFGVSMMSPRAIWRMSSVILAGCIVAMIMVLLSGSEIKGAQRWLDIAGFSIQPSEIMKPAFAVVAAWLVAGQQNGILNHGEHRGERKTKSMAQGTSKYGLYGFHLAALLYFILIFLLMMQPDLGMSVVLTVIVTTQFFLAGLRFRYLAALLGLGVGGLGTAYFSFSHVQSRIDRFLQPDSGDNYQVEQSLSAIRNGGFFGVGPGQGTEKLGLPDAHADFIFSVMIEEMGVLFALVLIGLYLFVLLRGFARLRDCGDMFYILAVGGLLTMFGLQAMIHMGSALNIIPAKGMTLPFISYGGSSSIAMGLTFGMVLALTRGKKRTSIARYGMSMTRAAPAE